MAIRIELYDTTLRDGAQSEGVAFSLHDKLVATRRLDELGIDYVEGGYPASNEKDKAYFEQIALHEPEHTTVCAFGMTRRKGMNAADDAGLQQIVDSGAKITTIVGKSSSYQAREVLCVTPEENHEMIADTVKLLAASGRRVFFDAEHFFDGWKENPSYALETLRVATRAGAEAVVLCDTNGGSMPSEISQGTAEAVDALKDLHTSDGRAICVGIHTHNDCGMAVANSLAAVEAGARMIQGTMNGLGERCGNADLLVVAANLALKSNGRYDVLRPGAIERITEVSRFFYELANVNPVASQPYVGKSAFTHKGGMHVSGINRDSASYEHVSPDAVGNERRILVSELSGKSNIIACAKKYHLEEFGVLDHDTIVMALDEITRRESQGYQYEAADGSFKLLMRKLMNKFQPSFSRLNYQTSVVVTAINETLTTNATVATVKLRVGKRGEIRHEVAEGDGPVDALNNALRKALQPIYPELREMKLVDYKVRVLNSDAATAATTRVIIESKDSEERWGTVGVSENVVEASWIALCDSIEYKLSKTFGRA
ncbi:MAG: citramalate synthase [Planctomycetia bacterium]|nr:citramalate synthase [Planctomycetia bacterium]